MAVKKFRSVKGRRMRLTALDECGAPDFGSPCGSIVTDGFISVTWADEVETGEEHTQKNAWGDFCVAEKDGDRVKWTNVTLSMCEVDPQTLVMLGGLIPNVNNDGDIIGAFTTQEPNPVSFALEVWTKKAGSDGCGSGGSPEWGYFAGVNIRNGRLDGDLVIENAPLTIGLRGELYGASSAWGTGPYGDNPLESVEGYLPGALRYIGVTTVQPPEPTDGCVAIVPATGATAGTPGTWDPTNAAPPYTFADLQNADPAISATPTSAWTSGQHVVLGDGSHAHWDGSDWQAGDAP